MTWPTQAVSTQHLDSGADNPALARADLKQAVDNLNSVVEELTTSGVTAGTYGNTQQIPQVTVDVKGRVTSATANYPDLRRYTEPVYTHTTTSGNVTVNFNNGNFQTITATGNITLSFANAPAAGTVTLVLDHNGTARTVTFPTSNIKYASNVRTVSSTASTDMIIATTLNNGSNYLVSIVKGFV